MVIRPQLGILQLGRLDIYATDLQPAGNAKPVSFIAGDKNSLGVIARLAQGDNLAAPSTLLLRSVLFGSNKRMQADLKS